MIRYFWMPTESSIHGATWNFTFSRRNWIYTMKWWIFQPAIWPMTQGDEWFLLIILGFWHIRIHKYTCIYLYMYLSQIYTTRTYKLFYISLHYEVFFFGVLSINHYQQYGWGLSALDKRRPCIRKWPRLWLGKDRKVMRFVPSVENRYLQMMQSIHATSGNDNQYNDYICHNFHLFYLGTHANTPASNVIEMCSKPQRWQASIITCHFGSWKPCFVATGVLWRWPSWNGCPRWRVRSCAPIWWRG